LSAREKSRLAELFLFVALVHRCFWLKAPLPLNDPWNNAQMLSLLKTYPIRRVAIVSSTALSCHLWYFSELFIGLAVFDSRVDPGVKRVIMANLQLVKSLKTPSAVCRVNAP